MVEFEPAPESQVWVRLEGREADLLRQLLGEMTALLTAEAVEDPVLERIFPDAYESEEDESAYRDLLGDELRTGKLQALQSVKTTLENEGDLQARLSPAEAETWLTALTDLRLAVGTRIGVTEEQMTEELDPDDPNAPALTVLHWLGWMQESLLGALNPRPA